MFLVAILSRDWTIAPLSLSESTSRGLDIFSRLFKHLILKDATRTAWSLGPLSALNSYSIVGRGASESGWDQGQSIQRQLAAAAHAAAGSPPVESSRGQNQYSEELFEWGFWREEISRTSSSRTRTEFYEKAIRKRVMQINRDEFMAKLDRTYLQFSATAGTIRFCLRAIFSA